MEEFGNLLFKDLDENAATAVKGTPFLAEFDKRSKLMFLEWEEMKSRKYTDQRGIMVRRAEAVYILYSLSGNVVRGDRIGKIIFGYANGSTAVEKLDVGYNIAPSGDAAELD